MYCDLADGRKVFYVVKGNPEGKPVLFLNGLSQSTAVWTGLSSMLEKDYKIILMDFVYQGQSDKTGEGRSLSQHADDVVSLMDLLDLRRVNLTAISFGSIVAQNILIRHTDRIEKIVLLSSYEKTTARFREIDKLLHQALELGGLKHMVDVLYPLVLGPAFFEAPPLPIDQLKELGLAINDGQAIKKLMIALLAEGDYSSQLKKIDVPTLVAHGEHDFLCLLEMGKDLAQVIPNSKFEIVSGVGHTLNIEAIPQITTILSDFFN